MVSYWSLPPTASTRPSASAQWPQQKKSTTDPSALRRVGGWSNVAVVGSHTTLVATPAASSPNSGDDRRNALLPEPAILPVRSSAAGTGRTSDG
jgi:hypothetical protein